jgi:hypothetical protein
MSVLFSLKEKKNTSEDKMLILLQIVPDGSGKEIHLRVFPAN